MTLLIAIYMFAPVSGACFNPTAGLALTFFGNEETATTTKFQFLWIYLAGPCLGGVIAGIFHLFHKMMLSDNSDNQKVSPKSKKSGRTKAR